MPAHSIHYSKLVTVIANPEKAQEAFVSSIIVDDAFQDGDKQTEDPNEQVRNIHFSSSTKRNTLLGNEVMFVNGEIDLKMKLSCEHKMKKYYPYANGRRGQPMSQPSNVLP